MSDRSKCYQRHIREVWEGIDGRKAPCSAACKQHCVHFPTSAREVKPISREEASSIILKYEWLAGDSKNKAPLGYGAKAYYGLFLNGELIGANCFGTAGGGVRNICGPLYGEKTCYLMRGACAHHAPVHAASFLTSMSCKLLHQATGWCIFFAYSDTQDASEIGTIYQSCGWHYIGTDVGRSNSERGYHSDFLSSDGTKIITSYQLNHDKERKLLRGLGWDPGVSVNMRAWLKNRGWTEVKRFGKKKWITFVGTEKEKDELRAAAVSRGYNLTLPYPKRFIVDAARTNLLS